MWAATKVFIRNTTLPVCNRCVYFAEDKTNYPYDALPDSKLYGRCKRFGQVNYITGVTEHDYAANCRKDAAKCGTLASEYSSKEMSNPTLQ